MFLKHIKWNENNEAMLCHLKRKMFSYFFVTKDCFCFKIIFLHRSHKKILFLNLLTYSYGPISFVSLILSRRMALNGIMQTFSFWGNFFQCQLIQLLHTSHLRIQFNTCYKLTSFWCLLHNLWKVTSYYFG